MSQELQNRIKRRQVLSAIQVFACPHCAAPGVYKADNDSNIEHFSAWPGVILFADDERVGAPVGDECPNCQKSRVPATNLGVIWMKEEFI